MSAVSAHYAARLDLARTREFEQPGAGPARRERLAASAHAFMAQAWRDACAATGLPERQSGVALAVVGSQARGDAGPLSDYDLVLLHDGRSVGSKRITELADALWYPLWDAGVRFDHSVRTLAQCRQAASSDLAAAVGMLDIASVAGDDVLVAGVRQAIAADWRGAARKRLPEVVESLRARHARFGDIATTLDPDLKESGGGLRDLSLVGALTTAWLADPHRASAERARAQLLDVRDALHVVTGRGRERLSLQDQDAVAALLGCSDSDELLTRVVDAARTITYVTDAAVRAAGQSQRARALRVGPRRPSLTSLGHGLHLHDGEVVLGAGRRDGGHLTLLRAAAAAASRGALIGPTTLANLVASCGPLPAPWPREIREGFVGFLASGPGIVDVWEGLDLSGIVDVWLPEWSTVRSRPQRNAIHQFTVDRHSIEAVVIAAGLREHVARPDLLLVAALLHDIGKVAGARDHSAEGAPVTRAICQRMGFDRADCDLVERLVREHLTLVDLATKRDPDDPATVRMLCEAAGSAEGLDLLDALTEADARAAGPQAWTTWRAGLVRDLAARARRRFASGETVAGVPAPAATFEGASSPDASSPSATAEQRPSEDVATGRAGSPPAVSRPSGRAPAASAQALDETDSVAEGDGVQAQVDAGSPSGIVSADERGRVAAGEVVVEIEPLEGVSGVVTVRIVDVDRLGLFADMAGVLGLRRTSVRSANLRTIDGLAVDTWVVEVPHGDVPRTSDLARSLRTLREGERLPLRALEADARRRAAAGPSRATMPRASAFVVPGASQHATVIEVRAADRLGLLFDVGSAFAAERVSVRSAHIATYAGRSADTFYVTDEQGSPLAPPHAARVIGAVLDAVGTAG